MAEPFVSRYLSGLREVLDEIGVDAVERVIQIIFEAYRKGRHIFIIGNGGMPPPPAT